MRSEKAERVSVTKREERQTKAAYDALTVLALNSPLISSILMRFSPTFFLYAPSSPGMYPSRKQGTFTDLKALKEDATRSAVQETTHLTSLRGLFFRESHPGFHFSARLMYSCMDTFMLKNVSQFLGCASFLTISERKKEGCTRTPNHSISTTR